MISCIEVQSPNGEKGICMGALVANVVVSGVVVGCVSRVGSGHCNGWLYFMSKTAKEIGVF